MDSLHSLHITHDQHVRRTQTRQADLLQAGSYFSRPLGASLQKVEQAIPPFVWWTIPRDMEEGPWLALRQPVLEGYIQSRQSSRPIGRPCNIINPTLVPRVDSKASAFSNNSKVILQVEMSDLS